MIKAKIKTRGMHCQSCEMLIKDALNDLDGVKKAEVSFKTGIVSVELDDSKVSIDEIKRVIRNEGYEVL